MIVLALCIDCLLFIEGESLVYSSYFLSSKKGEKDVCSLKVDISI